MAHAPSAHGWDTREQSRNMDRLRVPIGRRCCAACAELVERRLLAYAHVRSVHVDAANGVAYVQAEPGPLSVGELKELAGECCGDRCPVPLPDAALSSHHHAHTANPESGAHAPEASAVAEAEHAGMGHAGHDMSDPRMAAAMEADMKRRFWISLVLAVPVLAYSSLGILLLGGRALPLLPCARPARSSIPMDRQLQLARQFPPQQRLVSSD